ncbi:hypothetical protein E2C01_002429 [Portunus trituberculatus]|uniref:Uncharacterized protein n=1 Tax=Portunus trituberculatus TaxID=210409 RepID=A0A5B7CJD2_PORTR|nr:hypothetical protein [Portunus trituberculatus]
MKTEAATLPHNTKRRGETQTPGHPSPGRTPTLSTQHQAGCTTTPSLGTLGRLGVRRLTHGDQDTVGM